MMFRLLKDLINWKCNLYIKCKLGKCHRYVTASSSLVFLCIFFVVSLDLVHCSSLSNIESGNGRTLYEHGIFRHDKPWASISQFPPRRDNSEANNNNNDDDPVHRYSSGGSSNINNNVNKNSDYSPTISPPDNRDKYTTYDRFKRSVTTLNFHPKPKNHSSSSSSSSGLKTMRIFKYMTEDDVLQSHSESHHQTIFHPFMKNESEPSSLPDKNHSVRVVGGAKVNLKAKLDMDNNKSVKSNKENDLNPKKSNKSNQVIRSRNPNNEANQSDYSARADSESKSATSSQPKLIIPPTPSKPENILIFKPSLAIRKNGNKTSLIPSGKYAKLNTHLHHLQYQHQMSNGVGNSITAATSTNKQQQEEQKGQHEEEESTDPNSATVNDRSLIHNYFDSVVVLNEEEGQKQLRGQGAYREKTSNSDDVVDNVVGSGDDDHEHLDDGGDVDDKIKNSMSAAHPPPHPPTSDPSSFSFTSVLIPPNSNPTTRKNKGSTDEKSTIIEGKKNSSPNLPITKNKSTDNTNGYLVEKIHNKMNKTIGGNRDKLIVKVVKKSRKSKPKQEELVEDDGAQDGSERSRRSPFKLPTAQRFQQRQQHQHPGNRFAQMNMNGNHNHNHGGGHELARAAMFRRNTAIMMTPRIRQLNNHAMKQKVSVTPRIITTGSSGPFARTIIPMQPIPVMPLKKSGGSTKMKFMPSAGGPLGPGPVGPPLAAIKVMPLTQIQNVYAHPPSGMSPLAPLPFTQPKDLMTDSSKTIFNFKPFPESNVLNQAASSYYSPTYRRFQNRFQDQISNIMESGKELEDETNSWDESRPPPRRHRHQHSRPRPRSSGRHRSHRHHHPRHDHYHHRHNHSPHRSGAHSQHPHHHPQSPRGKKLNPKYKYPKNAESIQDILKYFDKEAPSPPPSPRAHHHGPMERTGPTNPKRQQSSLPASENPPGPAYTKMADLSGEFRDVHASLLKDIKEFAKRPSMFSSSSDNYDRPSKHQNSHSHSHNRDSAEGSGFFDPIDEIFNPKPKPVRDMIKSNHNNYDIKPDLYSLENIRERIALKRGKLGGRHKDKEQTKDPNSFQFDPPPHSDDEDYYDTHKPSSSRHNSDGGFSAEHTRHYNSKEDYDAPSSYSKKNRHNKQDSSDDSVGLYPTSHYKESHYKELPFEYSSAEYLPTKSHGSSKHSRKPIVLKRPNEGYRVREMEPKKKSDREHEYLWNPYAKPPQTVNLDSPLVLKSPQAPPTVLQPFSYTAFQAAAAQAMAHAKPPISEEEDIVEIHTGSPGTSGVHQSYASDSHHLKQERLKKMYMDVLQQKMQLEAALLQPQALPQLHHPQMSAIQSMHPSGSYLPQHNPLQLSRVSLAPPMSSYSPQTIVTHPPLLTGLSGMTTSRRKKPMRMKIHIYPNGNGNEGIEQGLEAANLLAGGGFGASGFSASNPPPSVVAPPNSQDHKMSASAIPSGPTGPHSTSPSGYGGTAHGQSQHQHQHHHPMPQTVGSAVKNKNVVLHLHVHRRNDQGSSGQVELETEGSNPIAATAMPPPKLTYKDIYDEQLKSEHQNHLQNHRMAEEEEEEEERSLLNNSSPQEGQESQQQNHNNQHDQDEQDEEEDVERDKSISMEAPIHDEKIEDVFHTIMKLRKRPASSSAGATAADKRKKRNRN